MVIFRKYISDIVWLRYYIRIDYFNIIVGLMCLLYIYFFEIVMINKKDEVLNLSYFYYCLILFVDS